MSQSIHWLDDNPRIFPSHELAFDEPNGLLAAGGDLSCERLLSAYSLGIFPWYNPEDPILWWSPDPRSVIYPQQFKPSRSLAKEMRRSSIKVTSDQCFSRVMAACAAPRKGVSGTWINPDMIRSYTELHKLGYAHSIECWIEDELVGGLYGIAIGKAFFGESMFSKVSNASKIGFATLCSKLASWDFDVVDCQVHNPHLANLGAQEIPRHEFLRLLQHAVASRPKEDWHFE